MVPRRSPVALALALTAVTLAASLAYGPTLPFAPSWDDRFLTTENPYLASPRGVLRLLTTDIWRASAKGEPSEFYRPLAMLSYAVSRAMTGASPASFRAGNVALHAVNAALVGLLAARTLGGRDPDERAPVAAATLAAFWFALTPLHVEAVVWLAGRFDLLGTTCALGALLANGPSARPQRGLTMALTAGALLCKEAFITVPVLLVLEDTLVLRRDLRPEARKYAVIAVLVAAFLGARAVIGVKTGSAATDLGVRALLASYAFVLATYTRLAFAPIGLDPFRPYEALGLAPTLVVLAVAAALLAAVARRTLRPSRGPFAPITDVALFGLALFVLVLAPVSLTGPTLGMVGDRYGYFPSVGLALALASGIVVASTKLGLARRPPAVGVALAASTLPLFGLAVYGLETRAKDWANERTLFEASLARAPTNSYAQYYVGVLDAQEGNELRARELLEAARAKRPGDFRVLNALCFTHLRLNELARAERRCRESLAANAANVRTWTNLASTYLKGGQFAEAVTTSAEALALKPDDVEARYVHAAARANLGDIAGAREDVSRVLTLAPAHPGARNLRAQLVARGLW